MPALVVTLLLAHSLTGIGAPATALRAADQPGFSLPGLFQGRADPLDDYAERQRCLSSAGVGLAGTLVGAALFGGGVWIAGMATNRDADRNLIGAPDLTTQRFFVPGFAAGGAFLGGALASLGTYWLVEPDDRPGVTR